MSAAGKPKIKAGYVRDVITRPVKYPFHLLKEGEYFDDPIPMEEAPKVRYAMEKFRRKTSIPLHMNRYPNGTRDHPEPHAVVGWPKGAEYTYKSRAKRRSDS